MNSSGKTKRQLFPEKLWDLVHKPSSGIKWSPDGRKIEIDRSQLERFLQTKVIQHGSAKFRSNNFDSFIRQLHFYGFKKCGNSYYHDKFQKAQPNAHHSMKRKYSNFPPIERKDLRALEKVTMYTIDINNPEFREDKVEAIAEGDSIKINLPKHISDIHQLGSKSLVISSFNDGDQNVLSAYFI